MAKVRRMSIGLTGAQIDAVFIHELQYHGLLVKDIIKDLEGKKGKVNKEDLQYYKKIYAAFSRLLDYYCSNVPKEERWDIKPEH